VSTLSKREFVSSAEWHAAILALENAEKLAERLGETELSRDLRRDYYRMVEIAEKVFPDPR
jgi:hypothetical protein